MEFLGKSLLGNEPIKAYLSRALATGLLHHTLLFSGREGIGKSLFAKAIATVLLEAPKERIDSENHPDLHVLYPEGKSGTHLIENLREMIAEVHKPPFEGKRKVFIICEAERMLPAAANAVLKTLEEPELDCMIILISSAPHEILPTILSRCIHLAFQPIPKDQIAVFLQEHQAIPPERARILARLSNGSLGHALRLHQNDRTEKAQQLLFDALEGKISSFQAMEEIDVLFNDLEGIDFHRQAEHLLAAYLMWVRDQELVREGGDRDLLYFSQAGARPVPALAQAEARVSKAKLALDRNVKFSACLDYLLNTQNS
jgi:replication-associated recombination protein RarA